MKSIIIFLNLIMLFFVASPCLAINQNIPPEIIQKSDDYIISKVGKDYFVENYRFLADKSYSFSKEYELHYEYIPLSRVSGRQESVRIFFSNDKKYPISMNYVACIKDKEIIEPLISREKAIELAQQSYKSLLENNVLASLKVPPSSKFDMFYGIENWWWFISKTSPDPKGGGCNLYDFIGVDAVTGSVQIEPQRRICK